MSRLPLLATLLTLCHSSLLAQTETLLRFTSFGINDSDKKLTLSSGGELSEPFQIPGNQFSEPVILPGNERTLALGFPSGVDSEGKTLFKTLSTFRLPEAGKRFLVVLVPASKTSLEAIVVRGDDQSFRPGNIMILNLSEEVFAADLGGKKLKFNKRSQTIFQPRKDDKNLVNYQMQLFTLKDGKPKRFAASLWPYFEKKRAYVFLYQDKKTKKPSYRAIDEFTNWVETEEE